MASSFSSRALRALGLPCSSSGPPPLALLFVLASSGPGVALAASAYAPSPPSPGSRKAWRKRLRFSRFSRRFSSRSRAFSSRSRAFCRSRSSRARMASRWLAAKSANRSSSCCRAPPARPRQPPLPPPPRTRPGRPCPRLSPPPQLPRLVAPPRMRHIVPTTPPAPWAEGPRAQAPASSGPGRAVGATAQEERRWRVAAAGLGPEEAGSLPGLRRVLSPRVELPPGSAISRRAHTQCPWGAPCGSGLRQRGEKRVSSARALPGLFGAGQGTAGTSRPRPISSATTSYLAFYRAISKQIILQWEVLGQLHGARWKAITGLFRTQRFNPPLSLRKHSTEWSWALVMRPSSGNG